MSCEDNPIGALQELSQAQGGRPTPFYELQAVSGESHCPQFTYEARWEELKAMGEGSSKVILSLYSQFFNIKHILTVERGEKGRCPEPVDLSEE